MQQRIVAYVAALVVTVVALVVGIRVVAGNSSALDRFKGGGASTTTIDLGPAPGPGQVIVKGTIDKLTAEGAQSAAATVATPFTLNVLNRGVGKATIENALVDGRRTSIAWGGGTPLPITGTGGAIELSGTKVDVDAAGVSWTVDGSARAFKPGAYRAGASVAVGAGGLASARDGVNFTADTRTIIAASGGVVVTVAPARVEITGPGKVVATGQLQVRDQTTRTPAARFQFGEGPYTVVVNPVNGRIELDAVLQGPFTKS
jgi:hypothetical protein